MLGNEVVAECKRLGLDFSDSDAEVDISDAIALRDFAEGKDIDFIINCAAYTAVDRAEQETDIAFRINSTGAGNLARMAKRLGAGLIHVSTDYVFDGRSNRPYRTDDEPSPASAYGQSKLEGERAVLSANPDAAIIRTEWLYGRGGQNFVVTMLKLMGSRDEVRVVDDQRGSPTLADDLARAIVEIVGSQRGAKGIYHFTNSGETTWFGFASQIYKTASRHGLINREVKLTPIKTADYPTPATRPAYSVLDCSRLTDDFGIVARSWAEALEDYLTRLAEGLA
jgi:dTDP-4-dehydrorhamnose reductase